MSQQARRCNELRGIGEKDNKHDFYIDLTFIDIILKLLATRRCHHPCTT